MKHQNQNQEFRFNEVLFEHRNKEYGAYVLRNESDRILTKALFVGVSLLDWLSLVLVPNTRALPGVLEYWSLNGAMGHEIQRDQERGGFPKENLGMIIKSRQANQPSSTIIRVANCFFKT